MEIKNKIYFVYDKDNNTIINCFIAIDDNIAKTIIKNQIDKNIKLLKYTTNANEKATIECFLENQKNYKLYEAFNQKKLCELKDFIPKIKIEKEDKK